MCLTIPMKIEEVDGFTALCSARGGERRVSLFLLQHEEVAPGDYLMVHQGEAREKVTEAEAAATWALYDEIFEREADAAAAGVPPGLAIGGAGKAESGL